MKSFNESSLICLHKKLTKAVISLGLYMKKIILQQKFSDFIKVAQEERNMLKWKQILLNPK